MVSCDRLYIPNFMNFGTGGQAILMFGLINLNGCNADITEGQEIWECAVEIVSDGMTNKQSVINITRGVQAILRLCLSHTIL
jgi:hypothetical protein